MHSRNILMRGITRILSHCRRGMGDGGRSQKGSKRPTAIGIPLSEKPSDAGAWNLLPTMPPAPPGVRCQYCGHVRSEHDWCGEWCPGPYPSTVFMGYHALKRTHP